MTATDEQLIYEIRNLLDVPGEPPADRVAPLAAAYGRRCEEVNARLRECQQLLRQGLRGEALHRAQHEPSVLEQLAVLTFDERPAFVEICLQLDIEPPPKLLTDVGARLTEAGETERVLSVLMRKHRLLALARAPLAKRILALRQIREADADNPIWQRDLTKFEQVRHQQIQTEAEQAYRTGDLATLIALLQELREPNWSQKPPTALVDLVQRASAHWHSARAAQLMRDLAPQLAEAFAQEDRPRARELKQQWESCQAALRGQAVEAEIDQLCAPALQWIEREDAEQRREQEYCDAVSDLETALSQSGSDDSLRQLWQRIRSFDRPLPDSLEQAVRARVRAAGRRRMRRRVLLSVVAAVVLAMVGGLIGLAWQQVHNDQIVAEHAAKIDSLLGQQRIEEARQYTFNLQDTLEWVAATPDIRSRSDRIHGLIEKERERRVRVSAALAEIEQAGKFDDPTFASLNEAERLIKAAQTLELKPNDLTQVTALSQNIVEARKVVQSKLDQAYQDEITRLEQRTKALAESLQTGADVKATAGKLAQEMRDLRGRSGLVSAGLVAKLDVLISQQGRLSREADERVEVAHAVERVVQAVPNLVTYRAALANYSQLYSGTPRANQFLTADKESTLWQAIERWNQFVEHVPTTEFAQIKPEDARKLLADFKRLQADEIVAKLPGMDLIAARVPYLESIASRTEESRGPTQKLKSLLNDPSITALRMIQVTQPNGSVKKYYLLEPPVVNGAQVTLRIVSGFELARTNKVVQLEQIVKSGTALDSAPPHVVLAQRLQPMLSTEQLARGWEQAFFEALETIQAATDIEPLVQLLFLQRVLEAGSNGSSIFAKRTAAIREAIVAAEIQLTVNWLNPDDQAAGLERQKALSLRQRLPAIAELRTVVNSELNALKQPWLDRYQWVGCLLKDDQPSTAWRCATRTTNNLSGELIVMLRDGADDKILIERIGKLQTGTAVLDSAKISALSEGRAVFAREER
ncbi:MAG: hypothetical protein JNM18_26890 [Planctomycetaceae bacterium]|nr:hypothetical protein [Planctomycetaceae bacterium]